tara:strand:+ start:288 stop:767 length:480 start_codon:yes stop_codon:yes gene_type:complete
MPSIKTYKNYNQNKLSKKKQNKIYSLKKGGGNCDPLTVDCLNSCGNGQLGINPVNMPPTVSEQAFSNRYQWRGNGIAGSDSQISDSYPKSTTCGSSNNNYLSNSLPDSINQHGGTKKSKSIKKVNKKDLKSKTKVRKNKKTILKKEKKKRWIRVFFKFK